MKRTKTIMVMLAVNDSQNGMSVDRLRAIEFINGGIDPLLSLDSVYLNNEASRFYPTCYYDETKKEIRVGRRRFPVVSYRTWVGNWCWDAVRMKPSVAASLFNYLCWHYHSKFSPEVGTEPFWHIWETRSFATAKDFEGADD